MQECTPRDFGAGFFFGAVVAAGAVLLWAMLSRRVSNWLNPAWRATRRRQQELDRRTAFYIERGLSPFHAQQRAEQLIHERGREYLKHESEAE
jgi:uncharacterized membrane protein YhiD involved in acid resistance